MNTLKDHRILSALVCLTLALALTIGNVSASPALQTKTDFTAMDAYVTEQMNNLGIPGMALGIVQGDQIVHLQSFGAADSSGRAVTPQTPFYIGSLTKSFTALAVMQLVEAGKIDLDAPVQTYLPWFALADKEASARITVRHLLNQTSGISTKAGNSLWASQQGLEQTVRGLDKLQLTQPVGSTYQYCNINFMIAGLIVEAASGQPYAEYVTEHIFEPLGMRHTHASLATALADGLAQGHIYMFGRVFSNDGPMPPANLPAGALIASVEDLAHYAIAQMNNGRFGEASVLSPQGMAELHAPAITTDGDNYYAMGWNLGKWEEKSFISHTGDDGRFHSVIFLMPEHGSGIILLANATGFMQFSLVDDIAKGILFLLDGKPGAAVSPHFLESFLYWLLLLTPLLQIFGILLIWRKRDRIPAWGMLLIVSAYLGLVFLLYRLALRIITLSSMLVFYPELGYTLVIVAALGIGWSVVYMAMFLLRQREIRRSTFNATQPIL